MRTRCAGSRRSRRPAAARCMRCWRCAGTCPGIRTALKPAPGRGIGGPARTVRTRVRRAPSGLCGEPAKGSNEDCPDTCPDKCPDRSPDGAEARQGAQLGTSGQPCGRRRREPGKAQRGLAGQDGAGSVAAKDVRVRATLRTEPRESAGRGAPWGGRTGRRRQRRSKGCPCPNTPPDGAYRAGRQRRSKGCPDTCPDKCPDCPPDGVATWERGRSC